MTATWTFGGTALSTYGKVTLINDYLDLPPRRGDDVLIPFQHGQVFTQKYYDVRSLTFGIALYTGTSATTLESTIDALKAKLAPRTQQTLAHTMADTTVRNISASVNELLEPDRAHNGFLRYVVTFKCAYPFFRLSTEITSNETTIDASPKAMVVTNPGTVEERDASIVLTGPLSNTVITNSTNGNTLTYTGTIASPRVVTIATDATTRELIATDDLSANKIANVTHSGASCWMVFNVGTNNLSITDGTATTGKVRVRFNAPFL